MLIFCDEGTLVELEHVLLLVNAEEVTVVYLLLERHVFFGCWMLGVFLIMALFFRRILLRYDVMLSVALFFLFHIRFLF